MTSPDDIDERVALCRSIMSEAGAIARRGYGRPAEGGVLLKGPQDFLTETDAEVERHIRTRLAEAFPGDGFLGEETGWDGRDDDVWVVDPIDGTANFARSIPHFCISVAYVSGSAVQLGAILNPVLDEFYLARRGGGAERNGVPIQVSQTTEPAAACLELGWSTRVPNRHYIGAMKQLLEAGANVRRGASGALALAYVADGRSDGYAELHMHPWDCLAGLLLVEEAGGVVAPFLEAGGLRGGGPVLAATPALAQRMSAATGIPLDLPRGAAGAVPPDLAAV